MRFRLPAFLSVLLALSASVAAQDAPRYGRLSDADKALTAVASDPDAGAVVLWDGGRSEIDLTLNNDPILVTRRHRRVKVLKESGYALGELSFYLGDDSQLVSIKGQTFTPRGDGDYRRVRLDRDAVRKERVRDGLTEVRFSMPALAPGAVFEFEYEIMSESLFGPPVWRFQSAEPTLASHFVFKAPEVFRYVAVAQGDHIRAEPLVAREDDMWREIVYEWRATDVPALREEPYTTTEADYENRVEIQLGEIRPPTGLPQQILATWDGLAAELDGHEMFGRRLGRARAVRDLAAGLSGSAEERARAAYDLVRTGFVWTGEPGFLADRNLDDVTETRSGSSGELGLLLLDLLRRADVPARPVLISTRSNGRVVHEYPVVSRFDRLLVLAQPEGGRTVLLDATDPNRPYGLLPVEALSGEGWIPEPGAAQWISFPPPADSEVRAAIQGTLAPDGTLDGEMRLRLDGYPALALRTAVRADGAEAASAAAADGDALALSDVTVDGLDDVEANVSVRAALRVAAAEAVGDELYLTPVQALRLDENPFQRATRAYPVDFAFPSSRSYIALINVPEGYAPEALPADVQLTLPGGAVTYRRLAAFQSGTLQVRTTLTVAAASVPTEAYPALRTLYDEIVAAESEAIVLVRSADGNADAAPPASPDAPPAGDADGEAADGTEATDGADGR